ncbi:hypothetical protein HDU76_001434 [Blyttiomyces sp. JEL0837]|nr:hypothetical protein HDU76_001434 [Blyttiomyces sp. JEL0837]
MTLASGKCASSMTSIRSACHTRLRQNSLQYSTSSSKSSDAQSQGRIIYSGPIGTSVKALKRISVTTLGLTYAATPLFIITSTDTSLAAISVMVVAVLTSTLSTALVQWVCNPYVVKITKPVESAPSDANAPLTVQTLTFFGNPKLAKIDPSAITPVKSRLFASWTAQPTNESKPRFFYVHQDMADTTPEFEALLDEVAGNVKGPGGGKKKVEDEMTAKQWDQIVKGHIKKE